MDTTLTVRLDTQLKDDAERTLDSLGLSMSSAIRVFLTHVVAQKALPFPVQVAPVIKAQREDAIEYPLQVEVEVLLEQMATITARMFELEQGESDAANGSGPSSSKSARPCKPCGFSLTPTARAKFLPWFSGSANTPAPCN